MNLKPDALSKRKEAERAVAKARKAVSVEGLPAGADPAVPDSPRRGRGAARKSVDGLDTV